MTPASARFSGMGNAQVLCQPVSIPAFWFFINPKAAEGRRTPGRRREGWARHSVRAAVVNPDVPVGNRRRAGDCAPYRRFAKSGRHSGMGKGRFM
jgi:hypothetical protein